MNLAVLHRRSGGPVVEMGAPPTWPAFEMARVRGEARALARAHVRRQAPVVVVLVLVGTAVVVFVGADLLVALGGAVALLAGWLAFQAGGESPAVVGWRTWAAGRHALERELRLLGSPWRLLWDRRVHGLPGPACLAIGPSGVWILWWPEPGLDTYADVVAAAAAVQDAGGMPAVAHVLGGPLAGLRGFVHAMACAPVLASADDIARAAAALDFVLLQEPVGL